MAEAQPRKLPANYIEILKQCFNEISLRNLHYSLRAFARDLQMSPSQLSEVLSGKANISLKKAEQIAQQLKFSKEDANFFYHLVELVHADEKQKNQLALEVFNYDSSYVKISNEAYNDISEWHNLAFLELICLDNFQNNHAWISAKLGITIEQTQKMITDLSNSKLIEEVDGKLKKTYDFYVLPNGNGSQKARNLINTTFQKASKALSDYDSKERDFSATFIHIKKDDLSEISEKIKCFRRELIREYESKEKTDSVHMLSIQLFRADLEAQLQ